MSLNQFLNWDRFKWSHSFDCKLHGKAEHVQVGTINMRDIMSLNKTISDYCKFPLPARCLTAFDQQGADETSKDSFARGTKQGEDDMQQGDHSIMILLACQENYKK